MPLTVGVHHAVTRPFPSTSERGETVGRMHSTWASTIATQLNQDQLPEEYFAMPLVTVGGGVQVDVGTFQSGEQQESAPGGVTIQIWAPPQPPLSAVVDFVSLDVYEVRVMQQMGGPQLRAAIELVSPANKDRASHRRAFAVKCAGYLQQGVAVVIVDVVTERTANLHAALVDILGLTQPLAWCAPSSLYAVAYRPTNPPTCSAWKCGRRRSSSGRHCPPCPCG